jgi:hypothetical protein
MVKMKPVIALMSNEVIVIESSGFGGSWDIMKTEPKPTNTKI